MRSPFLKFNAEMGIIYNIPPNTRDSKFFARENFFSNGAFFSLAAMLRVLGTCSVKRLPRYARNDEALDRIAPPLGTFFRHPEPQRGYTTLVNLLT